jgi:hypothetical protein
MSPHWRCTLGSLLMESRVPKKCGTYFDTSPSFLQCSCTWIITPIGVDFAHPTVEWTTWARNRTANFSHWRDAAVVVESATLVDGWDCQQVNAATWIRVASFHPDLVLTKIGIIRWNTIMWWHPRTMLSWDAFQYAVAVPWTGCSRQDARWTSGLYRHN